MCIRKGRIVYKFSEFRYVFDLLFLKFYIVFNMLSYYFKGIIEFEGESSF